MKSGALVSPPNIYPPCFLPCSIHSEINAVSVIEKCIADVRSWFIGNRLMINDAKTDFLIIGTRQQLEKTSIESIIIGDTVIKPLESVRNLGSWFDAHMRMNVHIGKICSKAFRGLYNIRQIRKFLTVQSTKTLIHTFVSSHLDYCNTILFGLPKYQLYRLQKVQNAAARVTFQIAKFDHITPALIDLHWLPVTFSSNCSLLFTSHYTIKVHPTLRIFYPWNQLLVILFVRLHNLFCSFQNSTALHLGIGPLLMLHLFYRTRCH